MLLGLWKGPTRQAWSQLPREETSTLFMGHPTSQRISCFTRQTCTLRWLLGTPRSSRMGQHQFVQRSGNLKRETAPHGRRCCGTLCLAVTGTRKEPLAKDALQQHSSFLSTSSMANQPLSKPLHHLSVQSSYRFPGSLTHSQTPLIKWPSNLTAIQLPLYMLCQGLSFSSGCTVGLCLPIIPLAPNTNPKTPNSYPTVTTFHLYETSCWVRAKKWYLFWASNQNEKKFV